MKKSNIKYFLYELICILGIESFHGRLVHGTHSFLTACHDIFSLACMWPLFKYRYILLHLVFSIYERWCILYQKEPWNCRTEGWLRNRFCCAWFIHGTNIAWTLSGGGLGLLLLVVVVVVVWGGGEVSYSRRHTSYFSSRLEFLEQQQPYV